MPKRLTLPLGLVLAMLAGTALAADPSAHQIYLALKGGQLAEAQQMIQQVLRDHPASAKAHFVAAEVDARAGNYGLARQQLAKAQSLQPGLPFESAYGVRELRRQLREGPGALPARAASPAHRFHLGWPLLLIGAIIVVWMIVRRRIAAAQYNRYPSQFPGAVPPGGPGGYPPGYAPGAGYGPGGGPGIMRGIGTGLAVGAGMAAGEELVNHMLNPNAGGGMIPDANAGQAIDPQVNADMGGNDFGMSDPGSWDDGGAGGGDGGWT